MRNRLLNLLKANAAKGRGAQAEGNIVYLYDYIAGSEAEAQWFGGISAEGFTRQLGQMSGDVEIRIDSPGGDVFGGRAIAQAIRDYPGQVTCRIDGLAASAASYIAIAGDKVTAAPGAFLMIHRSWTLAMGNCGDLTATAGVLEKIDGTIAASYAAKAGESDTDWLALMDAETWLTGAEAQALGLVDEVLSEQATKAQGRVAWDLAAFEHAPAAAEATGEADPAAAEASEEDPDEEGDNDGDPDDFPPLKDQDVAVHDVIAARMRRLAVDLLLTRTA
jgi:ATP-dependent Clp protease protease subunit